MAEWQKTKVFESISLPFHDIIIWIVVSRASLRALRTVRLHSRAFTPRIPSSTLLRSLQLFSHPNLICPLMTAGSNSVSQQSNFRRVLIDCASNLGAINHLLCDPDLYLSTLEKSSGSRAKRLSNALFFFLPFSFPAVLFRKMQSFSAAVVSRPSVSCHMTRAGCLQICRLQNRLSWGPKRFLNFCSLYFSRQMFCLD